MFEVTLDGVVFFVEPVGEQAVVDDLACLPREGTFYVHFKDRAAFVDAMHARFHARVQAAVDQAVAGLPPGARRLFHASGAHLDVSLANRGVKALSLEARSDPAVQHSMAARRERLAAAGVTDLKAMGWGDAEAAAQLLAAMTREISVLDFDAGCRLHDVARKRFLGSRASPGRLGSPNLSEAATSVRQTVLGTGA